MPTTCTGVSRLADAAKKVADPPITFSAFPKGVSTESRATDPTTSTVMRLLVRVRGDRACATSRSHALWRGDPEHRESVAKDDSARVRQQEPRVHDRRRLIEHVMLVIPCVHQLCGVVQVARDPMRLQRL